jgi:hypothetical protein
MTVNDLVVAAAQRAGLDLVEEDGRAAMREPNRDAWVFGVADTKATIWLSISEQVIQSGQAATVLDDMMRTAVVFR